MEIVTLEVVKQCLGNKFGSFYYLPAVGTRGAILLAWDPLVVTLSNPHPTENTLSALIQPLGAAAWWLTGVYGPTLDAARLDFLEEMVDVRELHVGPWMLVGDFNLLVNPEDKNNAAINRRMMARFRSKLNRLELKEIYLNGRRYTWSNERARATLEKIDRVFTTNCWEDLYPSCFLTALSSVVSDHCPLLLDLHADFHFGKRLSLRLFGLKHRASWKRCKKHGDLHHPRATLSWC